MFDCQPFRLPLGPIGETLSCRPAFRSVAHKRRVGRRHPHSEKRSSKFTVRGHFAYRDWFIWNHFVHCLGPAIKFSVVIDTLIAERLPHQIGGRSEVAAVHILNKGEPVAGLWVALIAKPSATPSLIVKSKTMVPPQVGQGCASSGHSGR